MLHHHIKNMQIHFRALKYSFLPFISRKIMHIIQFKKENKNQQHDLCTAIHVVTKIKHAFITFFTLLLKKPFLNFAHLLIFFLLNGTEATF